MNVMKLMKSNAGVILIVAIIAILVMPTAIFSVIPTSTATVYEVHKGYEGGVVCSDDKYATSYKSDGYSEDITVYGTIKVDSINNCRPENYRFMVYVNGELYKKYPPTSTDDKDTWADIPSDAMNWLILFDDWNTPAWTFNIKGLVTGTVKVVMEVYLNDVWPLSDYTGSLGYDTAQLLSGTGVVHVYGDQTTFEQGDSAPIFVKTGFTGMENGWTLFLYPPVDRPDLETTTVAELGDNVQRVIDIKIEEGWFKIGTTNKFEVSLFNHLFEIGFTYMFSVDAYERMPSLPEIQHVINEGSVTFTFTSEMTYAEIEQFTVWAYYGDLTLPAHDDTESWILFEEIIPAVKGSGNNYTATVVVNSKNMAGQITVRVVAQDVDGRASDTASFSYLVDDSGEWGSEKELNSTPFVANFFVWMIIIVAIIIGLMIFISMPMPMDKKIIILIILSIITATGAWVLGTTASLRGSIL